METNMITPITPTANTDTHVQALRGLLDAAGWAGQHGSMLGWWEKLMARTDLSPADHRVLDYIRHLEDAGIDMGAVV